MSDKTKKVIDAKPIKDLAKILDDLSLTEISYSDGDFSVSVSKAAVAQTIASAPTQTKSNQEENIDRHKFNFIYRRSNKTKNHTTNINVKKSRKSHFLMPSERQEKIKGLEENSPIKVKAIVLIFHQIKKRDSLKQIINQSQA